MDGPDQLMSFRSGKSGVFTYSTSGSKKITNWSVQLPNALQETTNGESGGFGEYIAGLNDLRFEVMFDYDVGTTPFVDFVQGATLSTVKLFVSQTPTWYYWNIPSALIESVENDLDVRGKVSCRLRCIATGGSYSFNENEAPPS